MGDERKVIEIPARSVPGLDVEAFERGHAGYIPIVWGNVPTPNDEPLSFWLGVIAGAGYGLEPRHLHRMVVPMLAAIADGLNLLSHDVLSEKMEADIDAENNREQ